jgi:hypothetical protein
MRRGIAGIDAASGHAARAHFTIPTEPLTGRKLGGVLLAIAGVVVLLGPGNAAELDAGETLARQMAVLAGAIAYAVNTVLARRRPAIDPLVYASGVTLVGALLAAPILLLSQVPLPLGASAPALVAVAWLGLFPTGLAKRPGVRRERGFRSPGRAWPHPDRHRSGWTERQPRWHCSAARASRTGLAVGRMNPRPRGWNPRNDAMARLGETSRRTNLAPCHARHVLPAERCPRPRGDRCPFLARDETARPSPLPRRRRRTSTGS